MSLAPVLLAIFALAQAPGHPANPIFAALIADGIGVDGLVVRLPSPTLPDGADVETSRAILRSLAGDDRAARELARDSVTAPFLLKTRDLKAAEATIRVADLYFIVHADLKDVAPDQVLREAGGREVEAGNMRFTSKILDPKELQDRKLIADPGRKQWYAHLTGRLLDRILLESTERAVATRSADSLVVATRTDPTFDHDDRFPNRWAALSRNGVEESVGPAQPLIGGGSYVKITRLASEADALFVEAHFAFVEPHGWFQGNPILRSKLGVVAQDQVRTLRREIQKKRKQE